MSKPEYAELNEFGNKVFNFVNNYENNYEIDDKKEDCFNIRNMLNSFFKENNMDYSAFVTTYGRGKPSDFHKYAIAVYNNDEFEFEFVSITIAESIEFACLNILDILDSIGFKTRK